MDVSHNPNPINLGHDITITRSKAYSMLSINAQMLLNTCCIIGKFLIPLHARLTFRDKKKCKVWNFQSALHSKFDAPQQVDS